MEKAYLFTEVDIATFAHLSEEVLDGTEGIVHRSTVLLLCPEEVPRPLESFEGAHLIA